MKKRVVYGAHVVCKIENIEIKKFSGVLKEYYVLKSVNNPSATLYIPTYKDKLVCSKIKETDWFGKNLQI